MIGIYILLFALFLGFVVLTAVAIRDEKKRFNKGICPHCATPLRLVGVRDHYERVYRCDECGYVTVIVYEIVDDYPNYSKLLKRKGDEK